MKTLTLTLIIIFLFLILFIACLILSDYIKVNDEIKNENWYLIQNNAQLEQLVGACNKELKKCKAR